MQEKTWYSASIESAPFEWGFLGRFRRLIFSTNCWRLLRARARGARGLASVHGDWSLSAARMRAEFQHAAARAVAFHVGALFSSHFSHFFWTPAWLPAKMHAWKIPIRMGIFSCKNFVWWNVCKNNPHSNGDPKFNLSNRFQIWLGTAVGRCMLQIWVGTIYRYCRPP